MPHSTEMMTIDGAKIRVLRGGQEGGGAQPLVFLHGAGGHTGWMAFLEELSQRFAVYAPEHPGTSPGDPQIETVVRGQAGAVQGAEGDA